MYTKQQIIEEIRKIATKRGSNSLASEDFSRYSKISLSTVRYHFGSWNLAVKEASLIPLISGPVKYAEKIDDDKLLLELIRLHKDYRKEPTEALVNARGKYSVQPYKDRWENIKNAFLLAKKKFPAGLAESNKRTKNEEIEKQNIKFIPQRIKKRGIIFGEPINFRGLRFAPVNEQGVVYLFGIISHELGYLIESVRTKYPDCEGKRCFDKEKNQWEHVKIEFEYRSSHFKEHGHKEDECDIIVCWIHDWKDCPLEVLELKSVIRYL